MKKWILILLGLFILGIILVAFVYIFIYNKPHPDYENLKADYSMPAIKLFKAYTFDQKGSDKLYLGRMIEIEGRLNRIEKADSLVIAVFVFGQDDFGETGIRCSMLTKFNKEAEKLKPDGTVRLKGYCTGFSGSDVILEQCSMHL